MRWADINKKMMLRFRNSKDFDKLIKKLDKQGYDVLKGENFEPFGNQPKDKIIIVIGKNGQIVCVHYEDNNDKDAIFKQSIHYIEY